MTTIQSSPEAVAAASPDADRDTSGAVGGLLGTIATWLTSTDHKIVGRLFVAGGLLGLLSTVVVNVLLAVERTDADGTVLDVDALGQLFDAQRVGLVFATALPLALGVCIAVVPLQIGARALAFPRLAVAGFWMWLGGAILTVISLANNGGTTGLDGDMVDLFLAAHGLMAIGLAAAAGALGTSILTTRAPMMTMHRVPFFAWSALVFAIGVLLVMPVLVGTIAYLYLDHRYGRTGFGGNTGIPTWIGWVFGQPTSFLFAIPAIGLFVETVPVTFRRRTPARGVFYAGLALIGVATFAGVTQQNVFNLPWAGSGLNFDDFGTKLEDLVPYALFNLLPLLGAGIVLLHFLYMAKPRKGVRPNVTAAFVFGFFAIGMVLVGMVGNALYAIDDLALQGTVFEEAVVVYVVYGIVLGVLGGVAYWSPKLWGKTMSTAKTVPLALLGVTATVLAAFPYYIAGFLGQESGPVYSDSDLVVWNVLVLVGHALMGLTVLAFIGLLVSSPGDDQADDPWDGHTIEWATTSPAPTDNFVELPVITSAEPLLDRKQANASAATSEESS